MKRLVFIILFITGFICAFAQAPVTDLYQYNYTTINPAFAGIDGQKITAIPRMMVSNGKAVSEMGFVGYETSIRNNGFGVSAITSAVGPQTTSFLNAFYNHQFKFKDGSKLVAAAKASDYLTTVDFTKYNPIDHNDPLLGSNRAASESNLLFGLGLLYKRDNFFVGISSDNLASTKLKADAPLVGQPIDMKKMFHYMVGVNFKLGDNVQSTHSIYAYTVGNDWRADLNNSIIIDWVIVGLSFETNSDDGNVLPKVNAGVKLKDKGQIVVGAYSQHNKNDNYKNLQMILQFNIR